MIAHLHGTVAHRGAGSVVIDVHGVGYLVHVTPGDRIPAVGETVEVHTSLQVREDSMTLYGFTDRSSLVLFELLLSSSGVGPRLALAALATHRPQVLRTAIAGADTATLTAIPGVGKKVAERLVLELKDKVGSTGIPAVDGEPTPTAPGTAAEPAAVGEVRDALLGLGYSSSEVQAALREVGNATAPGDRGQAADSADSADAGDAGDPGGPGDVRPTTDAGPDAGLDAADLLRRCLRYLGSAAFDGAAR